MKITTVFSIKVVPTCTSKKEGYFHNDLQLNFCSKDEKKIKIISYLKMPDLDSNLDSSPDPAVLSQLSCPSCLVQAVLSKLSCPSCVLPCPAVLFWLLSPDTIVHNSLDVAVMSWQSCPLCPVQAHQSRMTWQANLSTLTCPGFPV
jgi:hypothetical protein